MINTPKKRSGLLLTNTGTPEAPTVSAVRQYLKAFLSDKHVVRLPRLIWLPILYGLILPLRPRKTVQLYQRIWTQAGSPMRVLMDKLATNLAHYLASATMPVAIGMNYGTPSIAHAMEKLTQAGVDNIIALPLYPQYSSTTTAASLHQIQHQIKRYPGMTLTAIKDYADHPAYIAALASHYTAQWATHGRGQHLLISFHGIPLRYTAAGDPYQTRCETTAHLLASAVNLSPTDWTLCYQSRFGYDQWLKPAISEVLMQLPKQGITDIDVVCPGFAVDCLETLEEIAIRGEALYRAHGGKSLRYLSALNDTEVHLKMLADILGDEDEDENED